MKKDLKIVHVSDLHVSDDPEKEDNFNAMTTSLGSISNADLLVVSGDMAKMGNDAKQFESAANFITNWYKALGLEKYDEKDPDKKSRLIVCAGNHDIDRSVVLNYMKQHDIELNTLVGGINSDDQNVFVPVYNEISKAFQNYTKFCEYLGVVKPANWSKLGADLDNKYLFGERTIADLGVRFQIFNSAFLALGDAWLEVLGSEDTMATELVGSHKVRFKDADKIAKTLVSKQKTLLRPMAGMDYGVLYLGKYLMDRFERSMVYEGPNNMLNIGVLHHPPSWLTWDQRDISVQGRQKTPPFDVVAKNVQFILHGHEHTGDENTRLLYKDMCYIISAGAAHTRDWKNKDIIWSCNYSVLQVDRGASQISKATYYSVTSDDAVNPIKFVDSKKDNRFQYAERMSSEELRLEETVNKVQRVIDSSATVCGPSNTDNAEHFCKCCVKMCYWGYVSAGGVLQQLTEVHEDDELRCENWSDDRIDGIKGHSVYISKHVYDLNSGGAQREIHAGHHFIEIGDKECFSAPPFSGLEQEKQSTLLDVVKVFIDKAYSRRAAEFDRTTGDYQDTIMFTVPLSFYAEKENYQLRNGVYSLKDKVIGFENALARTIKEHLYLDLANVDKYDPMLKYDIRRLNVMSINIVPKIRFIEVEQL